MNNLSQRIATPSTQDLGALEGEVWLFGGPYSNLQALEALQAEARRHGVPATNILCTGDTVAYCGQPLETVRTLMHWDIPVLQGNCELSVAEGEDDCGCGFDEGSACSLLSVSWYRHTMAALGQDECTWMAQLPSRISFELAGLNVQLTHGSPAKLNEFVFASTAAEYKQALLEQIQADVVIAGHTGIPFGQALDKGYWLNAGTIGLPANDGTQSVWYLRLQPLSQDQDKLPGQNKEQNKAQGVRATWHRLEYDYKAAQAAMQLAKLPPDYANTLANGLWPSMDVLPQTERAEQGQALNLAPLILTK